MLHCNVEQNAAFVIHCFLIANLNEYDGDVKCCNIECPRGVGEASGSDVINMASSNTMTHLLLNATIPCRGYVRSWTYFRSRDTPRVFASVWRKEPAADDYFRLVGVNVLEAGDVGWHQVVILRRADRIAVQSGDFIGFHYSGADVYRSSHIADAARHYVTVHGPSVCPSVCLSPSMDSSSGGRRVCCSP